MGLGNELDPKRDEIERLLRTAHIHQVRGEREKAKTLLQQALELDAENASVWELLGDYRREAEDWQGAHDAYKQAHELAPDNAAIERKYAEAVLQLTRQQEQYQQWERAIEGKGVGDTTALPRNPGLAFLLSLLMPGVGQLYNGQLVKGGIMLGGDVRLYRGFHAHARWGRLRLQPAGVLGEPCAGARHDERNPADDRSGDVHRLGVCVYRRAA